VLARAQLRNERADHSFQTADLVNEAYLRIFSHGRVNWRDRRQFYAAAADTIRRILVEHARRRSAEKRGGPRARVPLQDQFIFFVDRAEEFLALNLALEGLAKVDPRLVEVVQLRFFCGLTLEQVAAAMGLSARTVKRDWVVARSWLQSRIADGPARSDDRG